MSSSTSRRFVLKYRTDAKSELNATHPKRRTVSVNFPVSSSKSNTVKIANAFNTPDTTIVLLYVRCWNFILHTRPAEGEGKLRKI